MTLQLCILASAVAAILFSACSNTKLSEKPSTPLKPTPVEEKTALVTQHGIASWYSIRTNGNNTRTASGRPLKNYAYTAAHKHWPLGSKVRVTTLFNGKSEILTITDRGPYVRGRIIDVTIGSAKRLGFYSRGITKVKVELLERGNWRYRRPR